MAKHKSKSRLAVINVNETLTLSTLGSGVVLVSKSDNFEREFYAISADLTWSIRGLTLAEGPIDVGVAHGDYTVTEIKENLDLTGMEDPSDMIATEQGRRKVRRSGRFSGVAANEVLNDGKDIRTPIRFPLVGTVAQVGFWAHNLGAGALTTGAVIQCFGKIYGRWL